MSTDAIVVLKGDHQKIRKFFRDFQGAGENATATKGTIAKRIIEELTVHTYLENEVMYPQVRALMPELENDVLESYEEHHVADVLCMELSAIAPDAERFDAKMSVLIENVTHHMQEEEQDWFPKVRKGLRRTTLQELGARMVELRPTAPPQPRSAKRVEEGRRRRHRVSAHAMLSSGEGCSMHACVRAVLTCTPRWLAISPTRSHRDEFYVAAGSAHGRQRRPRGAVAFLARFDDPKGWEQVSLDEQL